MEKSAAAFRTIGEVAEWLGEETHVLRFWESKFSQIKPVKRAGGRRYYRPSDMLLLGGLKKLLHDDGMTIKGAQKVLRSKGVDHVAGLSQPLDEAPSEKQDAPALHAAEHSVDIANSKANVDMDSTDVVELTAKDEVAPQGDETQKRVTEWPLPPLQLDISQIIADEYDSTARKDASEKDQQSDDAKAQADDPAPTAEVAQSDTMDDDGPVSVTAKAAVEKAPELIEEENKIPNIEIPHDPLYREVFGPTGVLTRLSNISTVPSEVDPKIISEVLAELEKVAAQKSL